LIFVRVCLPLYGLLDGFVVGLGGGLVADLLVGLHGVGLVILHCGCVCERDRGDDTFLEKKSLAF